MYFKVVLVWKQPSPCVQEIIIIRRRSYSDRDPLRDSSFPLWCFEPSRAKPAHDWCRLCATASDIHWQITMPAVLITEPSFMQTLACATCTCHIKYYTGNASKAIANDKRQTETCRQVSRGHCDVATVRHHWLSMTSHCTRQRLR